MGILKWYKTRSKLISITKPTENCNKNSEPILNTILGLSYATFQQLMGPFAQTPMINPIDRLYSMQSSYFRPEELQAYGECGVKDSTDH